MFIFNLLKLLITILLIISSIREFIKWRDDKNAIPSIWMGSLLQISIFTTSCYWLSYIFALITTSIWLLLIFFIFYKKYKNKRDKNLFYKFSSYITNTTNSNKRNIILIILFYIIPIINFLVSYMVPLYIAYNIYSIPIIFQIFSVVISFIIIDIILYLCWHIKYLVIKLYRCKKNINKENRKIKNIYLSHPISVVFFMFFIYIPLILI